MALGKLPGRRTGICVACAPGPTAYTRGGFSLHVDCVDLRNRKDVLSLYTVISGRAGRGTPYCSVHPELSGILKASGGTFTNNLQILAYGASACASGMMNEVAEGANLSHILFCAAVMGR